MFCGCIRSTGELSGTDQKQSRRRDLHLYAEIVRCGLPTHARTFSARQHSGTYGPKNFLQKWIYNLRKRVCSVAGHKDHKKFMVHFEGSAKKDTSQTNENP